MRVIAGEAGGIPLVAPPGRDTRPTTDKVKGAIFSSLGDAGCEGRVLDLFAGSGALGIEALSRGADFCDFVDDAGAAVRAIRANLEKTRLSAQAAVHQRTAAAFVAASAAAAATMSGRASPVPYDLILLDPPYALPELVTLLEAIGRSPLIGERTTLLLEHASRRPLPERPGSKLVSQRTRNHGDSAFTIYKVVDVSD
jgi:16S rRNA (guanine966-N2)-methyltransferase